MLRWNKIKKLSFLIMGVIFLAVSGVNAADLCSNIFNAVPIPFQLHNGGIVISVQINDYGQPLNFLLDTGDEILKIDGKLLAPGLPDPLSGNLLHRPEGTTIRLQLRRGGRTFDRSLTCRDLLP